MPRLLFFGRLREHAGDLHDQMIADDARSVAGLIAWIEARNPELATALRAKGVRIAIDQAFASADAAITGASEIAFMSPLSGG